MSACEWCGKDHPAPVTLETSPLEVRARNRAIEAAGDAVKSLAHGCDGAEALLIEALREAGAYRVRRQVRQRGSADPDRLVRDLVAHEGAPTIPGRCPDGGACGHACTDRCWRVGNCGPLSGVFPGDRWPEGAGEVAVDGHEH